MVGVRLLCVYRTTSFLAGEQVNFAADSGHCRLTHNVEYVDADCKAHRNEELSTKEENGRESTLFVDFI